MSCFRFIEFIESWPYAAFSLKSFWFTWHVWAEHSSQSNLTKAWNEKLLTTGDGESAMLPIDAFSSSTVAAFLRMSLACNGLILILNFLCDSSSSSDSLEE